MSQTSTPCATSFDYCATEHALTEVLLSRFERHLSVNVGLDGWDYIRPTLEKIISRQLLPALSVLICESDLHFQHQRVRGRPDLDEDHITTQDPTLLRALKKVVDCSLKNLMGKDYNKKVQRHKVTLCLMEIINFQITTNLLHLMRR